MSTSVNNPFMGLGAPPGEDDPESQVRYLKAMVDAFHATGNPRIKPLGQKLDAALEQLAKRADRGGDPEKLAQQWVSELDALRGQTYELLLTVVNQVRGTLRISLNKGMPSPEREDTERLQKALGTFAQGMRKVLAAMKRKDPDAYADGSKLLEEAGQLLEMANQSASVPPG